MNKNLKSIKYFSSSMNIILKENIDNIVLNNTISYYTDINFGNIIIEQLKNNSKSIVTIEKKRKTRIFEDILRISVFLNYKNRIIHSKFDNTKFVNIINQIIDINKQVYLNIGMNSIIMLSHLLQGKYYKYDLIFLNLKDLEVLNTQNELNSYSNFLDFEITDYNYLQKLLLKEERLLKSIIVSNNHDENRNKKFEFEYLNN